MPTLCLLNRQEQLEKLQRHQEHWQQLYPSLDPTAKRLVRVQLQKLEQQSKRLN